MKQLGLLARLAIAIALILIAYGASASDISKPFHVEEATLADVNAAMNAGTLTSEQLVRQYLARIAACL